MSRHQIRLLLCSTASVALIAGALFVLEWFRIDLGATRISIELRTAHVCVDDEGCKTIGLTAMRGFYPIVGAAAFWCGLPLALLVLGQCGAKMITGSATVVASKLGYVLASIVFLCAFGAGYLFAPETDEMFQLMAVNSTGTPAPAMLLAGSLLALLALRYAITDEDGEYKPIVLDKNAPDPRLPVTPLNVNPVTRSGHLPNPTAQRERIATPTAQRERIAGSDRIATPTAQRERIPSPTGSDRIAAGPGPRERVATGSYERIPLPGHRDRAPTDRGAVSPGPRERLPTDPGPGPRERVPTPGSFERIPLPGHRDRVPAGSERVATPPGPRDRVPTPGSFERIPLPGHRDGAATTSAPVAPGPGPRDRVPTPGSFERIPLPGHRDQASAASRENSVAYDVVMPAARAKSAAAKPTPGAFVRIPLDGDGPFDGISLAGDDDEMSAATPLPESMTDDELDEIELVPQVSPGGRAGASSDQPFVARTASPGGRAGASSDQPFVARTASPGARVGGSSDQPLVARTASSGGRAGTSPEQPFVARTASSGGRAGTSSEQPLATDRTKAPSQPGERTNSSVAGDRTKSPSQPGDRTSSSSGVGDRTKSPSQPGDRTGSSVAGDRTKSPSQPGDRTGSSVAGDRTKSPSQPGERSRLGSQPDIAVDDMRPRTSSSGPIDLAARLHGAPIAIAIKPPLPEPVPVPADQIPVAPESGLVIRKRTPSAAPLTPHQLPMSSPLSTSGAMASTAPVVIRPRSSSQPGRTPPGAMPSIGLRGMRDDMSDLVTKSATPPLAIPIVDVASSSVAVEPKRATPPREMPSVDLDVLNLELEPKTATPPRAMPAVDAHVSLTFDPTPLPVPFASGSRHERAEAAAANRAPMTAASREAAASPETATTSTPESAIDSREDLLRTQPRVRRVSAAAAAQALIGKLSFAVETASLTSIGISAQLEDGTQREIVWESIVGIIARRLPYEPPYDGTTFVDLVSTVGSTLRFLPWTQIHGAPVFGEGEERARAFVQLIAMRCLDAKLDTWTKVFADGSGHAAQLPTAKTLAAHDERLA